MVAALAGALTIVFDSAYQSYLPSLVRRDQLVEGNRKLALSSATAEIIGPGMTGLLVQILTAPIAILLDAASFAVSAASIVAIRRKEPAAEHTAHQPFWHGAAAGFRTIAAHPLLRPLALRTVTVSVAAGFFTTLYVLYAIDYLRLTPAILGLLIALGGAGNLFGALISERVVERFGLGRAMIGSHLLVGGMWLLIPLARGEWYVAAAFLGASQLFGDMAYPVYDIHEVTLRQSVTPPEVLGRVNACMQMLFKGIWPVGAIAGGLVAQQFGVRFTLTMAALGVLASSLWLVFSPVRALRGLAEAAGTR
jgi:predicted MFS family arabinose efflux permease